MMDVRRLISQLLDYELDTDVEVRVETSEEDDNFEFEVEEYSSWGRTGIRLTASMSDYVLITKDEHEEMKRSTEQLESKVEDLKAEIEDLNEVVEKLEGEQK